MVAWTHRRYGVNTTSRRCRFFLPFSRPRLPAAGLLRRFRSWSGCFGSICAMMTGKRCDPEFGRESGRVRGFFTQVGFKPIW